MTKASNAAAKKPAALKNNAPPSKAQADSLEDLMDLGGDEGATFEEGAIEAGEAAPAYQTTTAEAIGDDDDSMESLGGGARAEFFFVHKEYPEMKDNQVVIIEGDTLQGTYEGSFTSGRFDSRTHKLSITDGGYAGKVVGLPTAGVLDKRFQFVPKGTKAIVKYAGSGKIRTGRWKGQNSYSYDVAVPSKIRKSIEDGLLQANYELKEDNG